MRPAVACLSALLLAASSGSALATDAPPDTIAMFGDASRPVLSVHPSTGEPHVAFVSGDVLMHAWKSAGAWQVEPVATGVGVIGSATQYGGFDLQVAHDGRMYALYIRLGDLELAERVSGVWQPVLLDALQGPLSPPSLATSPLTGEPVAAWARSPDVPGSPAEVKLARRSGGSWTVQVLDTISCSPQIVGVAVDLADRPRVAWGRPRADDTPGQVLTCALASGPAGPFVAAAVDSQLTDDLALGVDPASGEPRVAYHALRPSEPRSVRYAARDGGLGWQGTFVRYDTRLRNPVSLAIDASGDPYIASLLYDFVAPEGLVGGERPAQAACFFTNTASILLHHRSGGSGTGAFQLFASVSPLAQMDVASGPRALVSRQSGVVDVAWSNPGGVPCPPYVVCMTSRTPLAGVGPGEGERVALAPIRPNPVRLGAPLHVALALERAAAVALELHDVAGRLVAEWRPGGLGPGPQALDWAPAAPRAGVYWLTARADGAWLGTRPVVLVR